MKVMIIEALVESAYQLGRYKVAISLAEAGIAANPNIVRLHHMHAKSIISMHSLLDPQAPIPNE